MLPDARVVLDLADEGPLDPDLILGDLPALAVHQLQLDAISSLVI